MRRGAGLCVLLGLLYFYGSVLGQDEVQPETLVFCDDPAVETAVSNALTTLNKQQPPSGNKLALYQILSGTTSENGFSSEYSIQFTSRRSDCPVTEDKLWSECDYLPSGPKEPRLCSAIVYVTGSDIETKVVECKLDHVIVPERAECLGCPTEIHVDSEELKVPLSVSISKYNSISDSTHLFILKDVGYATRQTGLTVRYKLSFDMRKSTCPKSEHKDVHELCVPDKDDVEMANCNSTVDVAPWRHEVPSANIECGPGPIMNLHKNFTRRRPPGWSPLRNVVDVDPLKKQETFTRRHPQGWSPLRIAVDYAEVPSETIVPPPPTAPVKESSEEEDPFHCPSKPWKVFSPVQPSTTALTEPAPTVEGALTDLDLLG